MPIRRSKYLKPNGPTSRLSGECSIEGCDRPLFRQGLCGSHFKRKQRKQVVGVLIGEHTADLGLTNCEVLSPEELVVVTGNAFLEADGDGDYKVKRKKFLKAMEKWMEHRGWSPPRKKGKR